MDEPADLKKRTMAEKMTQQEFLQHVNTCRDTTAGMNCPKAIDRIFLNSAMQTYVDAATHVRLQAAFNQTFAPNVPEDALSQILQSTRKVVEGSRRNWIRTVTKIKDGVSTAESISSFAIPGMGSEEAAKYRKLIKEKKPKNDSGGVNDSGSSRRRGGSRSRGRGGGGYYRNEGPGGGYDPYYGGDNYSRGRGNYDNRRPYNAGHGGHRGGGYGGRNYQDGRGHGNGGYRDGGYRDYNPGGGGGNAVPHTSNNG